MHEAVSEMLAILQLEQTDTDCFLGRNETRQPGLRLFGGQILAQALKAATMTVEADRIAHSMHARFLRPGVRSQPVLFQVERIRDGRSFSMRRVSAMQKKDCLFTAMLSFHIPEAGPQYQVVSGTWPPPEDLEDDTQVARRLGEKIKKAMPWALIERAFEVRSVYPINKPPPDHPVKPAWLRLRSRLPDDRALHQSLIAYATDMGLMSTAMIPHLRRYGRISLAGVSLDHTLWFHQPMRADEWWLYDRESPFGGGARGFNQALIFDHKGRLAVSAAQENLMRPLRKTEGAV